MNNCLILLLVCYFSCIFSLSANAKTIVISDLDDTIKITHVHDTDEAARNMLRTDNWFKGMSELYNLIQSQSVDVKFHYVSNSISWMVQDAPKKLLTSGKFPHGTIYLRRNFSDGHKLKTIRKILNEERPDTLLMFGDNAENDIVYYDEIAKEYAGQIPSIHTFIRIAYSTREFELHPLRNGQTGFVTPIEVMLELADLGFFNMDQIQNSVEILANNIIADKRTDERQDTLGPQYFPLWMNCEDFKWSWKSYSQKIALIEKLESKLVDKICLSH